ncbi:hypothetical protein KAR91_02310 [Candidatus Pacearchaeota archaeon]|nr:hypothetical protein [Candidatus Pacearchaeota archaeon]
MPELEYRSLAYTGPKSGKRIEFTFDGALNYSRTHNLGRFQFAGTDGEHYQDRSLTDGDFQFLILLDNQDDERELTALLDEKVTDGNPGTLEHPIPSKGTFPVVVSTYSVGQHIIKGAGRIAITVTFFRQIPSLIGGDPVESNNPASAAATYQKIQELNTEQATTAAESVQVKTGSGFAALVESVIQTANDAKDKLGAIAAKVDEINVAFTNAYAEIISGADELARAPFTLTRKIQNLIQLPMLAVDSVTDRIAAYTDYVNETLGITETEDSLITSGSEAGANILTAKSSAALAAISAINYSAVSGQSVALDEIKNGDPITETGYLSRPQIIETIKSVQNTALETTIILSQFAEDFGATLFFNQYFDYSILNKTLITSTVRNLNNRIFSAVQERRIINDREIQPIRKCAELYNSVEISTVQFFCNSNKLHGDEIYLIPKGRELVYYG